MTQATNQRVLELEQDNARRIERLESTIGEMREEVASLPGKVAASIKPDHTWRWAFGIIVSVLGGSFLLLLQNDWNTRSEIIQQMEAVSLQLRSHTEDRHPTIVQADVNVLSATVDALTNSVTKNENKMTVALKELDQKLQREMALLMDRLGIEIESLDVRLQREIGLEIDNQTSQRQVVEERIKAVNARLDMIMQALVKYMELGGERGRDQAEIKGSTREAMDALRRDLEAVRQEQTSRAARVYRDEEK